MWGIDQKLEEHTQMIDRRVDQKLEGVTQRLDPLEKEFHVHKLEFQEYRRRTDDTMKTLLLSSQKNEASQECIEKNVASIKTTQEQYLPHLKDAEEKRATKHQLKEGAVLVTSLLGAGVMIMTFIGVIWAYSQNYIRFVSGE